jgi:hypothetical protein
MDSILSRNKASPVTPGLALLVGWDLWGQLVLIIFFNKLLQPTLPYQEDYQQKEE